MRKTSRLTVAYLVGVVLLSSIDVVYERFETGESTDWNEVAGLRSGAVFVGSWRRGFTSGLLMDFHLPQFLPVPFFAGAGPDSGVTAVAVWFLALVAWIIHMLLRLRARRFQEARLGTPEK